MEQMGTVGLFVCKLAFSLTNIIRSAKHHHGSSVASSESVAQQVTAKLSQLQLPVSKSQHSPELLFVYESCICALWLHEWLSVMSCAVGS